jgi:hypothetical protein
MRISCCTRGIFTFLFIPLFGVALLSLSGCSEEPAPRQAITETRQLEPEEVPEVPTLTQAQRLGLAAPDGHVHAPATDGAHPPMGAQSAAPPALSWDTPPGWVALAPTQFRQANFQVAGLPEAECYLTVLPGDGGGLLSNLNRWRAQMGAEPLSEAEAAELPQQTLLGEQGSFMTVTGTYTGMGQQPAQEGYMMAAVAAIHEGTSYFVKMTGPEAVIQQELDNLALFVASLSETEEAAPAPAIAAEAAPVAEAAPAEALPEGREGAEGFTWEVPAGWTRGPDRPMRLATYTFGPDQSGECRIYIFPGMEGGLVDNVNRWRAQMGLPPQTPEEIAALPKLEVRGHEGTYLELEGDFTDMQAPTKPGQMMLGLICPLEAQGLFVKLNGPKEVVAGQIDAFKSFVTSIR